MNETTQDLGHDGALDLPLELLEPGIAFSSPPRAISESDVGIFADLTGDRNPQHLDEEWAANGPFGERIVHGLLLVSIAIGLAPLPAERVVALRALREVVFKRPARIGEVVHLTGTVVDATTIDEQSGTVSFAWQLRNHEGLVLVRLRLDALWRREAERVAPFERAPAGVLPL